MYRQILRVARHLFPGLRAARCTLPTPDSVPLVTSVRIVIGLVITAIVAVALVPMFALLDLAGGGDGLGLCHGGLASCHTSYFDGPELLGMLAFVLFLLLMLLRAAFHVRSLIQARRDVESVETSVGGGDRFGGG